MHNFLSKSPIGQLIPLILLVGVLLLAFMVLKAFLVTIAWAMIVSYVMWPAYCRLRHWLNGRQSLSAGLMTALMTVLLSLLAYWLAIMLQDELKLSYQVLVNALKTPLVLPEAISHLPGVGQYVQQWVEQWNSQPGLPLQLAGWLKYAVQELASALGNLGQNLFKLGIVLVTVFFCFRDGEMAIKQLQQGLLRFLGQYQPVYLQAAGNTVRAVVYGLTLAAIAQGICAGIGYAIAGVQAPVLFGTLTTLLALVPMGATLVWLPITILLLATGYFWQGVGLLLWCMLVVSSIDNVIRPWVISGTGKIPFLVVMFGVLGGLAAFGAIGLFLGPVVLALLLAVWQVWLQQQTPS
jgi:P-type Ca2+ transporter type 2C